jgi:hypothetical protein
MPQRKTGRSPLQVLGNRRLGVVTADLQGRGYMQTYEELAANVEPFLNIGSWIPLVDGAEPPAFITDGAGVLILVAFNG